MSIATETPCVSALRWAGAVLLASAIVVGCASGPAYRAAPTPGDYGYRDSAITSDRYQVSFSGGYDLALETVQKFALYRAAEVALAHGSPRFRILSQQTAPVTYTDYDTGASLGFGWGYPYWGAGFGVPITASSRTRYQSVLAIQIGDAVPKDGPNVYNASEVKQNLAALVASDDR